MHKRTTILATAGLLAVGGTFLAPAASAATLAPTASASPVAPAAVAVDGQPVLSITPNNCVQRPDETVKVVTWDIPEGLAIGGVTGKGSAADEAADILRAATSSTGGMMKLRSWVLPVTVLDGYTYGGPTTITLAQTTDAPNGDITQCPDPAAAGGGDAAPVDDDTVVGAPAAAPAPAVEEAEATTTVTPAAAAPAPTGELAFTGTDTTLAAGAAAALLTLGTLTLLHQRRRSARR